MGQIKSNQIPPPIQVINKPRIAYTKKSLQFFLKDRRKVVSAIMVASLPLVVNAWRFFPEDVYVPYYENLDLFVWTFSIHFSIVVSGIAWMLCVSRKDYVLHFLSSSVVAYGTYLTFNTLPIATETPLWVDLLAASAIFGGLYFCLRYIRNNYLDRPDDYKTLHDGLVYDIHHQRFMGSINRIAGLIDVADMEEPYKHLCAEEVQDMRESIAYIAEKYESLK